MDSLWARELDALKARFWRGETIEALAEESGIHPDGLRQWFESNRLYKETDIASTPDEVTYIDGGEELS